MIRWIAVFALLFVAYLGPTLIDMWSREPVFVPLPSSDAVPAALIPVALLTNGSLYLDQYADYIQDNWGDQNYFARSSRGHIISAYPILAAILATPVYVPFVVSGWIRSPEDAFLVGRLAAGCLALLSMGLLAILLVRLTDPWVAAGLTLALGLGTGMWTTVSQGLWQHTAGLPFTCAGLLLLVRAERDARGIPLAGLLLSTAAVARYTNAVPLVVIAAYVLVRYRRQLPGFVALSAIPFAALAIYAFIVAGSPFDIGYPGALREGWTADWPKGLAGLLISPAVGLLVFSPFLLVALVEGVSALKSPRSLQFYAALAFLLFTALMAKWWAWDGGWAYGNRMLIDVLPFLALLLAGAAHALTGFKARLVIVSVSWAILGQMLGLLDYGVNWQQARADAGYDETWLWNPGHSPILFYGYHYLHRAIDPPPLA